MDVSGPQRLKLAMSEAWYKEYGSFLMVPLLATAACCFLPLFNGDQGLNRNVMLPLTAACSYGHILSPRRQYYEASWKKIITYHEFILAIAKRTLLFAIPTCILGWLLFFFLNEKPKELTLFFVGAVSGISAGIFICSSFLYIEETYKLKKKNDINYRKKLWAMFKWILPPTLIFSALMIANFFMLTHIVYRRG